MTNLAPFVDANISILDQSLQDNMSLEVHKHQLLKVEGTALSMVTGGGQCFLRLIRHVVHVIRSQIVVPNREECPTAITLDLVWLDDGHSIGAVHQRRE